MKAYRHGEMILIPVPEDLENLWQNLFEQAGKTMDDPRVIAEGEVTGHKHEFTGGQVDAVELSENASARRSAASVYVTRRNFLGSLGIGAIAGPVILLKVAKASTLKHPEHNALRIPQGRYAVYAQREYDETMTRRVVD
ncbi:MAG: hypothetical protein H8E73_06390 [Planctomycetes bacterium]|nr:hypothetical protein [Planctomycetota bacterium]